MDKDESFIRSTLIIAVLTAIEKAKEYGLPPDGLAEFVKQTWRDVEVADKEACHERARTQH